VSRIGLRSAWRCTCGAVTFAVQKSEHIYLVAPHMRPDGAECEKSRTEQQSEMGIK
jgi:hypothetical protein